MKNEHDANLALRHARRSAPSLYEYRQQRYAPAVSRERAERAKRLKDLPALLRVQAE